MDENYTMDRHIVTKKSSFDLPYNRPKLDAGLNGDTSLSGGNRQPSYGGQISPLASTRKPVRPFRFDASIPLFAGDWSNDNYVALGSFIEEPRNSITIVEAQLHPSSPQFDFVTDISMTMPPTKIAWEYARSTRLLSSGDKLRLWQFQDHQLQPLASYAKRSKSQPQATSAPLTSFDWNKINQNIVITASIDTTCTLWDLASQTVITQLIAHDQEVNDVSFLAGSQNQFVSVGADGSARLFDLRSLHNSTIIYESPPDERARGVVPLLRITPSPSDPNLVCAIGQEQNSAVILDIRATRNPIMKLSGHSAAVNSAKWIPNAPNLIATGSDDCQLLVWDITRGDVTGAYNEIRQINTVLASRDGQWLGAINGKSIQAVSFQVM